jgi:hypothetical protein
MAWARNGCCFRLVSAFFLLFAAVPEHMLAALGTALLGRLWKRLTK